MANKKPKQNNKLAKKTGKATAIKRPLPVTKSFKPEPIPVEKLKQPNANFTRSSKPKTKDMELTKRTKLTTEQFERVRQSSGNGESAKYAQVKNSFGENIGSELSFELLRRLNLAKKLADKFFIVTHYLGRVAYIGDPALMKKLLKKDEIERELYITFNRKEALIFYDGFDEPELKIAYYEKKYNVKFLTVHF